MAFKVVQEYKLPISTTPSTARQLSIGSFDSAPDMQVRIRAVTTDAVIKFGPDNTVVADHTVTSEVLAAGNFSVPVGNTELFGLVAGDSWISAKSLDNSTAGFIFVTVGYGEDI